MTTIHVKDHVWKKLNSLKEPGETMNDVIERLLMTSVFFEDNSIDKDDQLFKISIKSDKLPSDISERVDDVVYD